MSLRSVYLFFTGSLMILAVVSLGGVQYWRSLGIRPPGERRAVPSKPSSKTIVHKKCFFVKTPETDSRPSIQIQPSAVPSGIHSLLK
ncbi:MAG: hypothetical protein ACKVS6_11335 [Planctomycetota bacterium]